MTEKQTQDLCQWLRDNSSGVYRNCDLAASVIEDQQQQIRQMGQERKETLDAIQHELEAIHRIASEAGQTHEMSLIAEKAAGAIGERDSSDRDKVLVDRAVLQGLVDFCEQPEIVAATDGAFDPDAYVESAKRAVGESPQ